ncbi:MAG: hypothetical protein NT091_00030, partial [Candidatus Falkowbacteria bacterium]|nr:hypothetical protein [Candidatus Falkowbacteria bacterium]
MKKIVSVLLAVSFLFGAEIYFASEAFSAVSLIKRPCRTGCKKVYTPAERQALKAKQVANRRTNLNRFKTSPAYKRYTGGRTYTPQQVTIVRNNYYREFNSSRFSSYRSPALMGSNFGGGIGSQFVSAIVTGAGASIGWNAVTEIIAALKKESPTATQQFITETKKTAIGTKDSEVLIRVTELEKRVTELELERLKGKALTPPVMDV